MLVYWRVVYSAQYFEILLSQLHHFTGCCSCAVMSFQQLRVLDCLRMSNAPTGPLFVEEREENTNEKKNSDSLHFKKDPRQLIQLTK